MRYQSCSSVLCLPQLDMLPHGGKKRHGGTFITMEEILDLNLLIKQIALAFGAAMFIGNVFAIVQNKRGMAPKGETGEFRAARAYWLLGVGALIATWGAVSLLV